MISSATNTHAGITDCIRSIASRAAYGTFKWTSAKLLLGDQHYGASEYTGPVLIMSIGDPKGHRFVLY